MNKEQTIEVVIIVLTAGVAIAKIFQNDNR